MNKVFGCRTIVFLLELLVCAVSSSAQTFTPLVSFDGANGGEPGIVTLVQGVDGAFYGSAQIGGNFSQCGAIGCGTAFRVDSLGTLTSSPLIPAEGIYPGFSLVLAANGNFYGVANDGGANTTQCYFGSCGTIFKVTPFGKISTLYSFCSQPNCTDGFYPDAPLIAGADGGLYGTTSQGGTANLAGTVFKITEAGTLTTLYSFCSVTGCPDGKGPIAALIQASDGSFYGTTEFGGNSRCPDLGCGTIFRMSPKGNLTTLHRFNGKDGWAINGLTEGPDGSFYGTSFLGGDLTCDPPDGCGVVFSITPAGLFNVVHTFELSDGVGPRAPLVLATDGSFYGATTGRKNRGSYNDGTLFKMTPEGALTILHVFSGADGSNPNGGLMQATGGTFYGATTAGGNLTCKQGDGNGCGTVYSLDMGLAPFVSSVRNAGKIGQGDGILGQGFTGTTSLSFNGTSASFTVVSDTFIKATVPAGATTGFVTVNTPNGPLTSNVAFQVIP